MKRRKLGSGGLTVSAIGLGCMGMSQSYGSGDDAESTRTLHRALDLGVTLLDTADAYGKGANETLIGAAIHDRRQEVVLASKFGVVPPAGSGPASEVDGRPERVRPSCEASLRRLRVDAIDLYYLHRVDPKVPIEDTVGAMAEMVREGKVRALGLSEAGPASLRRAHRTHRIAALQSEYSLWTRDPERTVFPVCRELGIGFVAFSPIGRGFFASAIRSTGQLATTDVRRYLPRFDGENLQRNLSLYQRLESMARDKGCTTAQLALAWLLAMGEDLVPIPGTKRRRHLEENVEAATLSLTTGEMAALDDAFPVGAAAGTRYPADSMRLLETEQPQEPHQS
jgi:aryl-alcohol dehydrogenase-like predicted oxidoreductase